ncbi:MAG: hypothetical protein IPH72_15960 [Sandaracinaceae bacterium]|nr:hypothetical protein [Sandaracinaceae bacterium]
MGTAIYYPIPPHRQVCFADVAAGVVCPVADAEAAATSLALPSLPPLREDEQGLRGGDSLRSALRPRG